LTQYRIGLMNFGNAKKYFANEFGILFLIVGAISCSSSFDEIDMKELPIPFHVDDFVASGFEIREKKLDYDFGYKSYIIEKDSVLFVFNDYQFSAGFFSRTIDSNPQLRRFQIVGNVEGVLELKRQMGGFGFLELNDGKKLYYNVEYRLMLLTSEVDSITSVSII
jgi:hypothetical protein